MKFVEDLSFLRLPIYLHQNIKSSKIGMELHNCDSVLIHKLVLNSLRESPPLSCGLLRADEVRALEVQISELEASLRIAENARSVKKCLIHSYTLKSVVHTVYRVKKYRMHALCAVLGVRRPLGRRLPSCGSNSEPERMRACLHGSGLPQAGCHRERLRSQLLLN